MKKVVISRITDLLTEEVLTDIGREQLTSVDTDTMDVIIQKAVDEVETQVYTKILAKINEELASVNDHVDKWW